VGFDVRVAQSLSVEGVLSEVESRDPAKVTALVLSKRAQRREGASAVQQQRWQLAAGEAQAEASHAKTQTIWERMEHEKIQGELDKERAKSQALEAQIESSANERRDRKIRRRRRRILYTLVGAHVLVLVGVILVGLLGWISPEAAVAGSVGVAVGAGAFAKNLREWTKDPNVGVGGALAFVFGGVVDLATLLSVLWSAFT
jgi:hypothetical protein